MKAVTELCLSFINSVLPLPPHRICFLISSLQLELLEGLQTGLYLAFAMYSAEGHMAPALQPGAILSSSKMSDAI